MACFEGKLGVGSECRTLQGEDERSDPAEAWPKRLEKMLSTSISTRKMHLSIFNDLAYPGSSTSETGALNFVAC